MFYRRIIVVLLTTLVFLSCNNRNKSNDEMVEDWSVLEEADYSIKYPHTWTLNQTGYQGTSFLIISKQTSIRDFYQENLALVEEDLTDTVALQSYVKRNIVELEDSVDRFQIIEEELQEVEGDSLYKLVYVGIEAKYKILYERHYRIKNKRAYMLTFACRTMEADRYKPVGKAMLESFSLK